jgi:hypothetical protein
MKRRLAYTTDQEVEEIMQNSGSCDIVDPQSVKRNQEGIKARKKIPSVITRALSKLKTACRGT